MYLVYDLLFRSKLSDRNIMKPSVPSYKCLLVEYGAVAQDRSLFTPQPLSVRGIVITMTDGRAVCGVWRAARILFA